MFPHRRPHSPSLLSHWYRQRTWRMLFWQNSPPLSTLPCNWLVENWERTIINFQNRMKLCLIFFFHLKLRAQWHHFIHNPSIKYFTPHPASTWMEKMLLCRNSNKFFCVFRVSLIHFEVFRISTIIIIAAGSVALTRVTLFTIKMTIITSGTRLFFVQILFLLQLTEWVK